MIRERVGPVGGADHCTQPPHIGKDAVDGAMIADPNLDTLFDEVASDVRLDVREANHQVGFEADDVVDVSRGKR